MLIDISHKKREIAFEAAQIVVKIVGFAAKIEVTQLFANRGTHPVETKFSYPVPKEATLCGFQAVVDGNFVKGELKQKEDNFETIEEYTKGNISYLAERSEDPFQVLVGSILPGRTATTKLTWLQDLKLGYKDAKGKDINNAVQLVLGLFKTQPSKGVKILPIDVTFNVVIESANSPSHKITPTLKDKSAAIGVDCPDGTKELVLNVHLKSNPKTNIIFEKTAQFGDAYTYAVMVPIKCPPKFIIPEPEDYSNYECIFIVDCSHHMSTAAREEVKRSLLLCLLTLPINIKFNMYRYGDTFFSLFPESKPFNDTVAAQARQFIELTANNMGGVYLTPVLQAMYGQPLPPGGHRLVYLIAASSIYNPLECIELAAKNRDTTKVFTVGVGKLASVRLVEGVARASNAASEFIKDVSSDRMPARMLDMMRIGLKGSDEFKNVRLKFGGEARGVISSTIPTAAPNSEHIIYAFIKSLPEKLSSDIRFTAEGDFDDRVVTLHEYKLNPREAIQGENIHYLAAKATIVGLEADKELNRNDIIKTSLHFRILSNYTYYSPIIEQESAVRIPMNEEAQLISDLTKLNLNMTEEIQKEWQIESDRRREEIELDKERILLELGARESAAKKERNLKSVVIDIGTAISKAGSAAETWPEVVFATVVGQPRHVDWQKSQELFVGAEIPSQRLALVKGGENYLTATPKSKNNQTKVLVKQGSKDMVRVQGKVVIPKDKAVMMDGMLNLGKVEGYWLLDEALATAIGLKLTDLFKCIPDKGFENAWATAIVLSLLETKFINFRDEWELVNQKALKYLSKQKKQNYVDFARNALAPLLKN